MIIKKSIDKEYGLQSTCVLRYTVVIRCHQDFSLLSYGKLESHGAVLGEPLR